MIPKHYAQRCVQPLRLVDRKVILYPEKRENPRHFLIIDPNPPIALTSVTVPYYPEANEVIQTSSNILILVTVVTSHSFTGHVLKKIGATNPRYKPELSQTTLPLTMAVRAISYYQSSGCLFLSQ